MNGPGELKGAFRTVKTKSWFLLGAALAGMVVSVMGCAVTDTLRATATAERKLGKSGAATLDEIAALSSVIGESTAQVSSSLATTLDGAAVVFSSVALLVADARPVVRALEAPSGAKFTKWGLIGVAVVSVLTLVHGVIAHARIVKHVRRGQRQHTTTPPPPPPGAPPESRGGGVEWDAEGDTTP